MDLGLKGKVALVTGASRGLGKAIARRLLDEGASVAILARTQSTLDEAAAELSAGGGQVMTVAADVGDTEGYPYPAAVQSVLDRFGRVDILVNNAGTHIRGTIDDTTFPMLEKQLHEKLFGFLGMIQAVMPAMRRQGDGRIVNVIGQAARHGHPDRLPSGTTNVAKMALNKNVADALARQGIRVVAVCPQCIETELVTRLVAKEMRERGVDKATASAGFTRATVLGRLGTPEEVADTVAFMASDRAGFICGSSVSIDGGYNRYVFG
ncbi:SDR family NAD(P)-dependent oxidoreductase [Bosea caraganae]|uniref:SDR family NAD(P)-dependent oxidoreductase n=1 Tax=Bosea caraganae TaxID=2763117 RepID=UPI0015F0A911|nr:SDR family oxidoreductase [Bosea caraganae]